jgi:hypothetical protein
VVTFRHSPVPAVCRFHHPAAYRSLLRVVFHFRPLVLLARLLFHFLACRRQERKASPADQHPPALVVSLLRPVDPQAPTQGVKSVRLKTIGGWGRRHGPILVLRSLSHCLSRSDSVIPFVIPSIIYYSLQSLALSPNSSTRSASEAIVSLSRIGHDFNPISVPAQYLRDITMAAGPGDLTRFQSSPFSGSKSKAQNRSGIRHHRQLGYLPNTHAPRPGPGFITVSSNVSLGKREEYLRWLVKPE